MAPSTTVRLPEGGFTVRLLSSVTSGELQVAGNGVECAGDGRGEQAERHDNADRDHCQDDAVLGHRLTLLDGVACAEVMDQILERHGFTPLRHFGRALARDANWSSGCGVDSKSVKTA